jgi:hypothetical protein
MEYTLDRLNMLLESLLDALENTVTSLSTTKDESRKKTLAKTIQALSASQHSIVESIDLISCDPFSGFHDDYDEDDDDFLHDSYPDVIEFKDTKKKKKKSNRSKKKKDTSDDGDLPF